MRKDFFIYRPILASVICLIISLLGIVALYKIPVSQFPPISPPSIVVRASFPGANAETSAKVVAAQLENQLNGVANLLYMATNTSSTGGISIRLTYEVGTDLNIAINEVLNRLYAARQLLPAVVQKMGINARKSSPDTLLSIVFYADPYIKPTWISNYLQRTVANDLYLLPTVGEISVRGAGKYALTAWLDPNKMARYNVSVAQIEAAINDQNNEYIAGKTNSVPFPSVISSDESQLSFNLVGQHMYSSAEQLAQTIISNQNNQTIRLKDLARVELSSNDYSTLAKANFIDQQGKFKRYAITTMSIQLTPGANQLLAKQQILATLAKDAEHFPNGLHYRIIQDNSRFVEASISNVKETMLIAIIIVAIIMLIFLQDWRACLIALCTIPVSVLGTIACLFIAGFSLNTLSLFALILAIGIVVDDAIVVIENIERLRQAQPTLKLLDAITMTLNEVFSAIIAIVLVLSVVFIPVMTLGGLSGIMYRQFAITIACAVVISGVCSLTLTPALCNLLMRQQLQTIPWLARFEHLIIKLSRKYLRLAEYLLLKRKTVLLIWLFIIIGAIALFKFLPTGFVPNEDQGMVFATINLPSSSPLQHTDDIVAQYMSKLTKNRNIDSVISMTGVDLMDSGTQKPSAASLIISLRDWSKREGDNQQADQIINHLTKLARKFEGMTIYAYNQPPIRGLSTTGGVEFYLEDRLGGSASNLETQSKLLVERLKKYPQIGKVKQSLDTHSLELAISPDVAKAKFYQVNLRDYYQALQTMYSNNNVNFAYLMQGLIWVVLEADYPFRASIQNLSNVFIHSNLSDKLIPLATISQVKYGNAPQTIQRFNGYLANKITVSPAKNASMGDVMAIIQQEMSKMPNGYNYDWFGTSFQAKQSQHTSGLAFIFALIMIYLVLAALYERWFLPIVVLAGIPCAILGAGLILLFSGSPNDLYFQISLIVLLGLSAKNVILLVEFALHEMRQGHSILNSAINALHQRFRPILMTSLAFIGGTLPLVFASGAGANAQHSVGLGIIGGILGSLLLTPLLIPAFLLIVLKFSRKSTP
ncbi:MAG: hypothetical protein RLZZ293_1082 [Pseudomonadota bacterium]|jgi:HAE1 family hydrophobic/amphiphilic exporter-1/multidrug efflux pump